MIAIHPIAITTVSISTTSSMQSKPNGNKMDNVSDIQSLKSDIQQRTASVGRWNNASIFFVVLAFVAAGGLVVTSIVLKRNNDGLDTARDRLASFTEKQYEADSKTKDRDIAALNKQAASSQVEALRLQRQMLLQGPRANLLVGESRNALASALEMFPGQKIDVRRSAFVFAVNGKPVSSTPIGDDVWALANAIIPILRKASWKSPPEPGLCSFTAKGIVVGIAADAPEKTMKAAKALVTALSEIMLATTGPIVFDDARFKQVGLDTLSPSDSMTIILEVHPRE